MVFLEKRSVNKITHGGISTLSTNADTFGLAAVIHPDYATYGDDELRCREKEILSPVQTYPLKDWANPGCQSKNKYGPW